MRRAANIILVVVCVVSFAFPVQLFGGSDDFQNLEFFLERALKNSKDSTERNEVINRYLLKALALVYQQNKEQIRLDREALNVLKQLRDVSQDILQKGETYRNNFSFRLSACSSVG
ncbi:MAG: hypothetical protein PVH75_05260 [Syntrophobacterales bacterium]